MEIPVIDVWVFFVWALTAGSVNGLMVAGGTPYLTPYTHESLAACDEHRHWTLTNRDDERSVSDCVLVTLPEASLRYLPGRRPFDSMRGVTYIFDDEERMPEVAKDWDHQCSPCGYTEWTTGGEPLGPFMGGGDQTGVCSPRPTAASTATASKKSSSSRCVMAPFYLQRAQPSLDRP